MLFVPAFMHTLLTVAAAARTAAAAAAPVLYKIPHCHKHKKRKNNTHNDCRKIFSQPLHLSVRLYFYSVKEKVSTSNNPQSVILIFGITGKAINDSVINGSMFLFTPIS